MGYLQDFQLQINKRDFSKFLQLWEEYCAGDDVNVEEFSQILRAIKESDFCKIFGKYVENALTIWQMIDDPKDSYQILKQFIDLQTTNSPTLANLAFDAVKNKYGSQPQFNERLRLV